jgi:hypothetical protein
MRPDESSVADWQWTGPAEEIGDDLADDVTSSVKGTDPEDIAPPRPVRRRRRSSWGKALGVAFLLAITAVPLGAVLPMQVDGVAYLTGLEPAANFNPVSYSQSCDDNGSCSTQTDGYISGSGYGVTWPGEVPLYQPIPVHEPVWAWGTGRSLMNGPGYAIGAAGLGFLCTFWVWAFVIWGAVRVTKAARRRLQQVTPRRS